MQVWCGRWSCVYVTFGKLADTNIANANQPIAAAVNTATTQKRSRSATAKPWLIADVYGGPNPLKRQVRRRPSSPGGGTRWRTTSEKYSVRFLSVAGLSVGMFVGGARPASCQREAGQSPTTQINYVWISHLHRGPQLHGPVLFCSSCCDQAPRLL
jgi:hypothetical protein